MIAVADAGPLIAFARAKLLWLLEAVFDTLFVPEAVFHEVVRAGLDRVGAREISAATWIRRQAVRHKALLDRLPSGLGPGEREAIALAHDLSILLLADDKKARALARQEGVRVTGSLAVLLHAKQMSLIPAVRQPLELLVASGYRISRHYAQLTLNAAGEQE